MKVIINKPAVPRVNWSDIRHGALFSWGAAEVWYVKTGNTSMVALGGAASLVDASHLRECSTLRIATKVEITP